MPSFTVRTPGGAGGGLAWKLAWFALKRSVWAQLAVGATLVTGGYFITRRILNAMNLKLLREEWDKYKDSDIVVLHQFERATDCPSASPFAIKLETYLRMAELNYVNDFSEYPSSKGKLPWMTLHGVAYADSQYCIDKLRADFHIDLDEWLTQEQKAQARSIRIMLEDHFYWTLIMEHYAYTGEQTRIKKFGVPPSNLPPELRKWLNYYNVARGYIRQARAHGMGRHSMEEVRAQGLADLKALSELLGVKAFMFGTKPSELDCTVFGFLCIVLYVCLEDCVYVKALNGELHNLKNYVERIKFRFWEDWEGCRSRYPVLEDGEPTTFEWGDGLINT